MIENELFKCVRFCDNKETSFLMNGLIVTLTSRRSRDFGYTVKS